MAGHVAPEENIRPSARRERKIQSPDDDTLKFHTIAAAQLLVLILPRSTKNN
jgi:hypothetical protein